MAKDDDKNDIAKGISAATLRQLIAVIEEWEISGETSVELIAALYPLFIAEARSGTGLPDTRL